MEGNRLARAGNVLVYRCDSEECEYERHVGDLGADGLLELVADGGECPLCLSGGLELANVDFAEEIEPFVEVCAATVSTLAMIAERRPERRPQVGQALAAIALDPSPA